MRVFLPYLMSVDVRYADKYRRISSDVQLSDDVLNRK